MPEGGDLPRPLPENQPQSPAKPNTEPAGANQAKFRRLLDKVVGFLGPTPGSTPEERKLNDLTKKLSPDEVNTQSFARRVEMSGDNRTLTGFTQSELMGWMGYIGSPQEGTPEYQDMIGVGQKLRPIMYELVRQGVMKMEPITRNDGNQDISYKIVDQNRFRELSHPKPQTEVKPR